MPVTEQDDLAYRVARQRHELTPVERRIADVVLADPESVAFGTVAGMARKASTSGASVVRFATKLGYSGFVELQDSVQRDLARRLRPASERIRQPPPGDVVGRTLSVELDNLHATLASVDRDAFGRAVQLLSAKTSRVGVVAGDAAHGIAHQLTAELGMLRGDVDLLAGSEVQVARRLADFGRDDVLFAIDIRRYDRWVLSTVERASSRKLAVIAVTDSPVSPLAARAEVTFTVSAVGAGPFDSHVGTLALANALVSGVAGRLRQSATRRLDQVEQAWRDADALVDL